MEITPHLAYCLLEIDKHGLDLAIELERPPLVVGLRYRRAEIHADIECLRCREGSGNGALDRDLGDLLAIHGDGYVGW